MCHEPTTETGVILFLSILFIINSSYLLVIRNKFNNSRRLTVLEGLCRGTGYILLILGIFALLYQILYFLNLEIGIIIPIAIEIADIFGSLGFFTQRINVMVDGLGLIIFSLYSLKFTKYDDTENVKSINLIFEKLGILITLTFLVGSLLLLFFAVINPYVLGNIPSSCY